MSSRFEYEDERLLSEFFNNDEVAKEEGEGEGEGEREEEGEGEGEGEGECAGAGAGCVYMWCEL